jgi:hypothetical protein
MTGLFGKEGVRERRDNGEEGAEAREGRGLEVEVDESMAKEREGGFARARVTRSRLPRSRHAFRRLPLKEQAVIPEQ